jgi:hypothetical protein
MDSAELIELLLTDMVAGRRTETLYMGRTLELAARLRDADLASRIQATTETRL